MCKIMMLAGVKQSKVSLAWKWAIAAAPFLAESDKDGFGYAAVGNGHLWGERWVNPKDAFRNRTARTRSERYTRAQFGSAVDLEETYNRFGRSMSDRVQAIMLHSRYATCAKGIQNTHPFVHLDDASKVPTVALIHNGVISNSAKLQNKTSTCDSECILNEYGDSNVPRLPANIQDMADLLEGYYACGVLAHNGEEHILDVFKSVRASLYVAFVPKLGTHVFCTTEEILRSTAKKAKMRLSSIAHVNAGHLIRLSVKTGRVLSVTEFDDEGDTVSPYAYGGNYKGFAFPKSAKESGSILATVGTERETLASRESLSWEIGSGWSDSEDDDRDMGPSKGDTIPLPLQPRVGG